LTLISFSTYLPIYHHTILKKKKKKKVRFGTRTDAASALALCRRLRTELVEDYPAEVMLQKSAIIRQLLRTGVYCCRVWPVCLFLYGNQSQGTILIV
jgi:hypothetical protein